MKRQLLAALACAAVCSDASLARADNLSTIDGEKYENVRDIIQKPAGLYFVYGPESSPKSVLIPYTKLSSETKEKYHCDPFEMAIKASHSNQRMILSKSMAFSLDQLEAARAKGMREKKLLGFIMVWDSFFTPASPMGEGSQDALADFYDVFHDNLVLVFVRHESELNSVPDAVKKGFFGPEEGGIAPNMCVVTPDCSQFVCEIPYGNKDARGPEREKIFRQKIEVIKQFLNAHPW